MEYDPLFLMLARKIILKKAMPLGSETKKSDSLIFALISCEWHEFLLNNSYNKKLTAGNWQLGFLLFGTSTQEVRIVLELEK